MSKTPFFFSVFDLGDLTRYPNESNLSLDGLRNYCFWEGDYYRIASLNLDTIDLDGDPPVSLSFSLILS